MALLIYSILKILHTLCCVIKHINPLHNVQFLSFKGVNKQTHL